MGANCRAHQNCSLTGWGQDDFRALVQNGVGWVLVLLLDFFGCQSSDEDGGSVPDDLDDFGWWEL